MDHRAPEARRLAEADVARDHGVEDELREVLAHLALDVARQARAAVVHRQQHAGDGQARVELALDRAPSVSSRPARPSSAKYSVWTGTITRSAATSALTVSGPSDGGQSSSV